MRYGMTSAAKRLEVFLIAEKIEVKKRKIKKLFKELPSDKAQFADGLIAQFAVRVDFPFFRPTKKSVSRKRRYPVAFSSHFTALSKSLLDLLPEKAQKQAGNELMGFITQPKAAGKP